jgi:hypothetical protein
MHREEGTRGGGRCRRPPPGAAARVLPPDLRLVRGNGGTEVTGAGGGGVIEVERRSEAE